MLQSFCGLSLEPCPCLRYAWECQTQEGGWGLDGVLREHSWKLQGIVNGMDYSEWSPEHDAHLRDDGYCNYGLDSLARGKAQCKEALQRVRGGCWGLIAGCWPVVERVLLGSRCRLPSVLRGLPGSRCRLLALSACGSGFGLAMLVWQCLGGL